ncbi:MAG TPA: amino acid permease [Pyrinomonadaceae bacterium]|jgi:APA family basic amino acid/polyamine antiporter|nr:amino acid permease [Pyrinomonadaceae bacterium]
MLSPTDADANERGGPREPGRKLARRLGLFDVTMLVMGGIVGAGIFMNPAVVARSVHTPALMLAAWALGGLVALAGALVYAELAARLPEVGGQYAYLREAFHPSVAFLYGWVLLLVVQTGGMAAVAVTFAHYFLELTHAPVGDNAVAAVALAALTVINCLGVRAGGTVQSALMVLKIAAIVALVACGLLFAGVGGAQLTPVLDRPASLDLLTAFGAALTPVMFAYGGWQTSGFVAGEMRNPRRDLARGLVLGVLGVVALYLAVSFVCVAALGAAGLAASETPASAVMRLALGERGAKLIAAGIAVSTLGFLSQGMLTAPRVYFAMAEDGLFFPAVARVSRRTRVPVVAIVLQGLLALLIAASKQYGQILNYVVSVDFIFFGLTGLSLLLLRRRARVEKISDAGHDASSSFKVPGHPLTTVFFVAACWLVVAATIYKSFSDSVVGLLILAAGVPAYLFWSRRRGKYL